VNHSITFIGTGHLASSIIKGLIHSGVLAQQIHASNRSPEKLSVLAQQYGIITHASNVEACQQADVILLGVKPQFLESVCREIRTITRQRQPLIISLATAATTKHLSHWLGHQAATARVMTNIACAINQGCSIMYANATVTSAQRNQCQAIFAAVGAAHWVTSEKNFDAYTALTGCAPAYFYLLVEAVTEAAKKTGVAGGLAETAALETLAGACKLACESKLPMQQLREQVATPGGATAQSLEVLMQGDFFALFAEALASANKRCLAIKSTLSPELDE